MCVKSNVSETANLLSDCTALGVIMQTPGQEMEGDYISL